MSQEDLFYNAPKDLDSSFKRIIENKVGTHKTLAYLQGQQIFFKLGSAKSNKSSYLSLILDNF